MTTPYDSAHPDLLEEIISQGEKRLQAQLELGKAADQRAMTFGGLLLASVAALIGLGFGDHPVQNHYIEIVGVATGFVVAAVFAGWSAKPAQWDIVGNVPENYLDDINANLTFEETRPETAAHIQDMIAQNHDMLACNGTLMSISMTIAIVSATAGVIAAILP